MDCKEIINRFNKLKCRRDGFWLDTWREVRKYVYPTYSDYKQEGGARGAEIFDTTAIKSRQRLAAGIYNWMAPPDKRWFEMVPADEELAKDEEVKDFFSEATKVISFCMANSNWPTVLIQTLNELSAGLDGVVYSEDGGMDAVLNFRSFPVETVAYAENSKGMVDTVFREVRWTARQIAQEFGVEKLPEKIRKAAGDEKRQDEEFNLIHAVFPRHKRNKDMADNINKAIADMYIDPESKTILYESGYDEMPFAVCRFEKSANEAYGRGPGLNMLPDIKMLNRMRQAYIVGSEFDADPSWLVPDGSLVNPNFNKGPGAINPYKPSMNGAKPEPVVRGVNTGKLAADIEAERENIKTGFFGDIFDPLGDLKSITATEAEIRNESKMIPFAPIAGNLHSELFKPIIHRVFCICQRRNLLPPLPEKLLANPEYKVEFVSKIALSIKKLESLGWLQTEASLANIAAVKPDVMDNFELDDVARDVALVNGTSPKWLVPVRERDRLRQARAQAQAQAAQAEMLMQGAQVAPDLNKAPEIGSVMDKVIRGNGI